MSKEKQYDEIDLSKIGKALWHRLWLILLVAVLGGCIAFSITFFLITPMYEAETLMYVNNNDISIGSTSVSISSGQLVAAQQLVDTYIVILKSRKTLEAVISDTGVDYSVKELRRMISAEPINSTEVFTVNIKSDDPAEAALIANSIAKILPDKISDIVDGSSVRIVDYAIVPSEKVSPSFTKNTVVGFVVGLLVACIVIIIITLLDSKIHDEEYLIQTYNLPVLAVIPNLFRTDEKSRYYKSYKNYGYGYYGTNQSKKGGSKK